MKKRIIIPALSLCVVVAFVCAFLPASAQVETPVKQNIPQKALAARFTNMLNRNFSYNADFESADILTGNSLFALTDKCDSENPDYIPDSIVKGFVNDMYGIGALEIRDTANVRKDGFVYIEPRGYTTYRHNITGITENEDGSYTVISEVNVHPHDDSEYKTTAETLFVPNADSAFGYNIIYSDLGNIGSDA